MGRPKKTTADWIPLDVNDGKTFFILSKNWGNDGFTFWVQLLRLLGRSEGLYFRLDETTEDYLFASVGVGKNTCYDIIDTLVRLGNIDRELWKKERIIWCQGLVDRLEPLFEHGHRGVPAKPEFCGAKPLNSNGLAAQNPDNGELCAAKLPENDDNTELCAAKVHKISKDKIIKINNTKEKEIKQREENKKQNARDARAADEPPLFVENDLSGDALAVTASSPDKPPQNKKQTARDYAPPEHLADVWPAYVAMRNSAKRGKDTYYALELIIRKLQELAPNNNAQQREIIEQSIMNKWIGVFPVANNAAARGSRYGPQEVDKGRISNTLVEALKEVELETKKETV